MLLHPIACTCRSEAALSQLQHYASLSASSQLDAATVQGAAGDLACFAAIDEASFGSMEALDKQVGCCWLVIGVSETLSGSMFKMCYSAHNMSICCRTPACTLSKT
jgi:hypothetical protein